MATQIFNDGRWWTHSAYTYGYINTAYDHSRSGTTQNYTVYFSMGVSSGATYNYELIINMYIDGVGYPLGWIPANSGTAWYREGSANASVANKINGSSSFYIGVFRVTSGGNELLWCSPTYNLTVDNAYPVCTSNPYVTSRTINTLSFNIGGWNIASDIYYSLDNATWSHATNQNVTIGNMSAGTTYTIYVQARNQADHSLTATATCQGTTLPSARITSPGSNFSINSNSSLTINCSNSSGCQVQYFIETWTDNVNSRVSRYYSNSTNATSYTFTASQILTLSQYIKDRNSMNIRVGIATMVNNNRTYWSFSDGTYKIVNSNPTFTSWTYEDTNSRILALTGNNQIVVKNYSTIKGIVTSANKANANNYATMSKYRLTIGNTSKETTYSNSTNVSTDSIIATTNSFTMYAIDSRGNSTSVTKTASAYKNYSAISINANNTKVTRGGNGVGSETTLHVEGNIWNDNFGVVKNSIKSFHVFYKLVSESTYTEIEVENPTIEGNTFKFDSLIKGDLDGDGFTIANTFHIKIDISDELSSSSRMLTLGPGMPLIAIHPKGVAIGSPFDGSIGGGFQVNGRLTMSFRNNITDFNDCIMPRNISCWKWNRSW